MDAHPNSKGPKLQEVKNIVIKHANTYISHLFETRIIDLNMPHPIVNYYCVIEKLGVEEIEAA